MTLDARFSRARTGDLRLRIIGTGHHHKVLSDLGLIALDRAPHLDPRSAWRRGVGFKTLAGAPGDGEWQVKVSAENEDGITRLLDALAHHPDSDAQKLAATLAARREKLLATEPPPPYSGRFGDTELRTLVHARPTQPGAMVIDELGISVGTDYARADVATLADDCWSGVEIKGERDSTTRLQRQVAVYNGVFDRCELLTVSRHVNAVLRLVPDWWQVTTVDDDGEHVVQAGDLNPEPSPGARAQLLWRDEAYALLQRFGQARRMSAATRLALCDKLGTILTPDQARVEVMSYLRRRTTWLSNDGAGRVGL